ncbi:MAG: hypothetical protein IPJ74_25400 [Saprospiraceae bacterium]|nr:hypothetical protein [Saprospiraceae bacterium]
MMKGAALENLRAIIGLRPALWLRIRIDDEAPFALPFAVVADYGFVIPLVAD